MKPEAYFVLGIASWTIVLGIYGMIRAHWLYCSRVRILDEDFKAFCDCGYGGDPRPRYKKIEAAYNQQFWSFWIWDITHWIK